MIHDDWEISQQISLELVAMPGIHIEKDAGVHALVASFLPPAMPYKAPSTFPSLIVTSNSS